MEELRDGDDECRDESKGIADKQCQFVVGVECLASQPQSCSVGNELRTYR